MLVVSRPRQKSHFTAKRGNHEPPGKWTSEIARMWPSWRAAETPTLIAMPGGRGKTQGRSRRTRSHPLGHNVHLPVPTGPKLLES